jgi:hypothetical protein
MRQSKYRLLRLQIKPLSLKKTDEFLTKPGFFQTSYRQSGIVFQHVKLLRVEHLQHFTMLHGASLPPFPIHLYIDCQGQDFRSMIGRMCGRIRPMPLPHEA